MADMADEIIVLTDWGTEQPIFIRENVLSIEPMLKRSRVTTASGKAFDVMESTEECAKLCWPGRNPIGFAAKE